MRTLTSALLIIALSAFCRGTQYDGFTVYDIFPRKEQQHLLKSLLIHPGLDIWRTSLGELLTVMVPPSIKSDFLNFLNKHGIKHRVYIKNIARDVGVNQSCLSCHSDSLPHDIFNVYLSHQQMNNYLDLLAKKYPAIVHVNVFGKSFEKRQLKVVKISTDKHEVKKRIILIDAGIHAREWLAPAMALFIINQLVENETNRYLTEDIEWHINPLLNPDGYEYSRNTDIWWRKTRSRTKNNKCLGVDPNRNFNFHWNECGTSSDPCSSIYSGEKPFSEMETQALRNYVMSIKNQLSLYLTFHSYGPFILYPWGYTNQLPYNAEELQTLAENANEAQMKAGGPAYQIGSSENTLYCAAGGSDDWVMSAAGVPLTYTIELPPGGKTFFHPPARDIRKYVTPLFEAVRTFGNHISNHERGRSGTLSKGHMNAAMNTRDHLLNINYLHIGCLLVIEFIL